jgi:hypothetical protein
MTISNLNQNNYLIGNDLWVRINGLANPAKRLKLKVENLTNAKKFDLILYASPANEFLFNIVAPVRALFDAPIHDSDPLNTLARLKFTFDIEFLGAFANDTQIVNKNFMRGFRQNKGYLENYINPESHLIVGKWLNYNINNISGIDFDICDYVNFVFAIQKMNLNTIPFFNSEKIIIESCNYKIIKFLNSLGGYQYYVFEAYEIKDTAKPLKNIPKQINNFNDTAFQSLGTELNKEIEFYTETKSEDQVIISDLIKSFDVLMWDVESEIWIKLVPNTNTTIFNTKDKMYKNKIKYDFYTEVNNSLLW